MTSANLEWGLPLRALFSLSHWLGRGPGKAPGRGDPGTNSTFKAASAPPQPPPRGLNTTME